MRRAFLALSASLLIAAACGDSPATNPTVAPTTSVVTSPTTTSPVVTPTLPGSPPTTAASTTTTSTRPRPDGDAAPDFTLALGEGGSFTLSEETRPVFLLFWAEW